MKRMLLILVCFISWNETKAQGQGNIEILNQTSCGISIDVVAVCRDGCNTESSLTMWTVPAGFPRPSTPDTNPFFKSSTYPWAGGGGTPPCSNWEWWYVDIYVGCDFIRVGNCNVPCAPPTAPISGLGCGISSLTDCNNCSPNSVVQASWSVTASGDILIIVW